MVCATFGHESAFSGDSATFMGTHQIKQGLNLPIGGVADPDVLEAVRVREVAIIGRDYPGLRPKLHVAPGDRVRQGQLLVTDARNRSLRLTAPAPGRIRAVNRGERRRLESVVIAIEGEGHVGFSAAAGRGPASAAGLRELLLESGLWSAFRNRPFGRVPDPAAEPVALFVTAMETEPLAPPIEAQLTGGEDDFARGVRALRQLTAGPVFVCRGPEDQLPDIDGERVRVEVFEGPHPAGLAGTHIHRLAPVSRTRAVWSLHAVDVVAIGHLLRTGRLKNERVVALAGPGVRRPRLLSVRAGASLEELTHGELTGEQNRLISGSVLSGRAATGPATSFLGRFDRQISVLPEGGGRHQPAWLTLGLDVYTATGAYVSAFRPASSLRFSTAAHGAPRAMIPLEAFDAVMPLDILPTPLLRAISARDTVRAEDLGCLELLEEDLALCTLVDPGKGNWGDELRDILDLIEKEG
jgi:Na+-transporting NADH:ubiquinone oxidoreductase subunit A